MSYPERFMYSVLEQTSAEFDRELSFVWSEGKRYDFHLPHLNCIIETHGEQHYNGNFERLGGRSLKEEVENDKYKKEMALENGIEFYIVIDCRKSDPDYIKDNILNSDLKTLLDLDNIDWLKCHESTCSSLVKESCNLWNSGIKNTVEIGKILKINRSTIGSYLKQGVKLGWCDYDPLEVMRSSVEKIRENVYKKVVQLSLGGDFIKEWSSIVEASRSLGMKNPSNIILVCNGKRNQSGEYQWMYKEDYEQNLKEIKILKEKEPVVQLSLDGQFISEYKNAYQFTKVIGKDISSAIYKCCRGEIFKTHGYMWMFKSDYKAKDEIEPYTNKKLIPIVQLTKEGNFVKEWKGILFASQDLGVNAGHITESCQGKRKTAGGFRWAYKSEYKEHCKSN